MAIRTFQAYFYIRLDKINPADFSYVELQRDLKGERQLWVAKCKVFDRKNFENGLSHKVVMERTGKRFL